MTEAGGNGVHGAGQTRQATLEARQDPLIGQVLDGRYRIESVIGEGGMGLVYKAVHAALRKPLAIKVLRPEVSKNEQIVARFKQEAQSASQIGNQHIIDISDFGELPDGSTYFVMEFLGGRSLTLAMEQERLSTERTIHIAKQLCKALGAAHENGIVHRDMKPDNVQLIERGDDKDFVKVLDFGIAKVGGGTSKLTQAGQVFGTPHYMSPEQCAGTGVDHRTDLYAVGVMLYEMATGAVPFDADNLMGILTKHLYENPIPPHELPPPVNVPPALEAVILKCLTKKAEQRYQTMAELLDDLEAVEVGLTPKAVVDQVERNTHAGQSTTGPDLTASGRVTVGLGQPGAIPGRRSVVPMLIGGVLLLAIGGGAAAFLGGRSQETQDQHVVKPATETPAKPEPPPQPAAPEPPPPPAKEAAAAEVTIRSEPIGAEVYRDNALLGNTPYALQKPKDGERVELELRLGGYVKRTFSISSATRAELNLALTPDKQPSRRPSAARRPEPQAEVEKPARPKPDKPRRGVDTEVLDPWD
jgi:eukaryotic-like serine/threonine-protein kinase